MSWAEAPGQNDNGEQVKVGGAKQRCQKRPRTGELIKQGMLEKTGIQRTWSEGNKSKSKQNKPTNNNKNIQTNKQTKHHPDSDTRVT